LAQSHAVTAAADPDSSKVPSVINIANPLKAVNKTQQSLLHMVSVCQTSVTDFVCTKTKLTFVQTKYYNKVTVKKDLNE
jgi:hypothetical protein